MHFLFFKNTENRVDLQEEVSKTAVSTWHANRSRLPIEWAVVRVLRGRQQKLFSLECFPPDRIFQ